jgi:hypothetical protein
LESGLRLGPGRPTAQSYDAPAPTTITTCPGILDPADYDPSVRTTADICECSYPACVEDDCGLQALIQRYAAHDGKIAWDARFAAHQVERALIHLDFARSDLVDAIDRYLHAEQAYRVMTSRPVGVYRLTPPEVGVVEEHSTAHELLPFRMEVYMYQARIVLDRVARLLNFAFRPASREIGSHSDLVRNLPVVVAEHGRQTPPSLLQRIQDMTRDVKDIRDRHIVHPSGPRGHLIRRIAVLDDDSGEVRLKIKWATRDEDDNEVALVFSEDFTTIDDAAREYVCEVVSFIQSSAPTPA